MISRNELSIALSTLWCNPSGLHSQTTRPGAIEDLVKYVDAAFCMSFKKIRSN